MPSGSFRQIDVQCPFYKHDDGKRRITCEGLVDRSSLSLTYLSKKDYEIQIETFCCKHFDRCEVYRMLMEKYEEE
jgi:hypothetical protein